MESILLDQRLKAYEMGTREWFDAQRAMIKSKPLIKRCYDLWYEKLLKDADSVPTEYRDRKILELGSGSSYLKELSNDVITSDIAPGIADLVIDGRSLPFEDQSLRAIFLTHVFHHIPDISEFMKEADRVLVPGGVISMVECSHTPFAKFFFSKFHPEPYNDQAEEWGFKQTHSMLDSNQALSWIVFRRDFRKFQAQFPEFTFEDGGYLPWATYLLSGGVNLRSLIPAPIAKGFTLLDSLVKPLDSLFAIHWHLTLRKAQK